MRIVAGKYKGRTIAAPDGKGTRPTSDRARESIFNVIAHAPWAPDLNGARVIDLFAGSGALGLEALSRGAGFCLFVETDSAARGAIRNNVETFGLFGQTRIHRRSATELGPKPAGLGTPFTFAFLDPPYHQGLTEPALASLASGNWLDPNAVIIVETGRDESLDPASFDSLDSRVQGAARITCLRMK